MIEIRVDGEPVGKGRPRFVRATGRAYTPEATASYEAKVAWAGQQAMRGRPLLEGPLRLTVEFHLTMPQAKGAHWRARALQGFERPTKRPDLDNMVKAVCDALNKVVWFDDSQVVHCTIDKFWSLRPGIKIVVDNLSKPA